MWETFVINNGNLRRHTHESTENVPHLIIIIFTKKFILFYFLKMPLQEKRSRLVDQSDFDICFFFFFFWMRTFFLSDSRPNSTCNSSRKRYTTIITKCWHCLNAYYSFYNKTRKLDFNSTCHKFSSYKKKKKKNVFSTKKILICTTIRQSMKCYW